MRSAIAGGIAGIVSARAARGQTLMHWPPAVRRVFPFALGGAIGIASAGLVEVGRRSVAVAQRRQSIRTLRSPLLVGTALTGLTWLIRSQHKRALGGLFQESRALDHAIRVPPPSIYVSGGPGSVVPWSSVGREGARFLSSVTSAADMSDVGVAPPFEQPIRVYAGYDSAPTIEGRVELAMAELRRTSAFDRSVLLVQATAGTGFANPTPVDIVEIMTGGDCATVAVSYGLLPSFLSLDRVRHGVETQRLLLEAIAAERPRARILLYGESLGATVQQGALDLRDITRFGIDRVLWVGTPGSARYRWPTAIVLDNPTQIPDNTEAQVWLLEHDADPVVRMNRTLAWRKPDWLQSHRGRGVPEEMMWRPLITHAQVLVDVLFATDVRPGDFQSLGHDYRADLAAVVTAAYGFPSQDVARLDNRLRTLEIARAARIERAEATNP
jgi:uncharacterized membrane protein